MEVSEAKRLKTLKEENAELKRSLADAFVDASVLKTCGQKFEPPAAAGKPSPVSRESTK